MPVRTARLSYGWSGSGSRARRRRVAVHEGGHGAVAEGEGAAACRGSAREVGDGGPTLRDLRDEALALQRRAPLLAAHARLAMAGSRCEAPVLRMGTRRPVGPRALRLRPGGLIEPDDRTLVPALRMGR